VSKVRDTLMTLTPNRLVAIARTYGATVEDTRVHESVADAVTQAIHNGKLSIPRLLEECDREDLLRMRLTAGLGDDDLRETAPELLRHKIALKLGQPERNRPPERAATRGRGPRPSGSTPRTPEDFARLGVRETRLSRNPDIDNETLFAPPTRDELLALAENDLTPPEVRDAARKLAR
jgi:hypothetical protein